jgi:hypothetical protein
MFSAILAIMLLPLTDLGRSKGLQFRPLKILFWAFVANFLMSLGACHVEDPYIAFGQTSTGFYFSYFILLGRAWKRERAGLLIKSEKRGPTIILNSGFNSSVAVSTAKFVIGGTLVNTLTLSSGGSSINYTEYFPVVNEIVNTITTYTIPMLNNTLHFPFRAENLTYLQSFSNHLPKIFAHSFNSTFSDQSVFYHLYTLILLYKSYVVLFIGVFTLPVMSRCVNIIFKGFDTFMSNIFFFFFL